MRLFLPGKTLNAKETAEFTSRLAALLAAGLPLLESFSVLKEALPAKERIISNVENSLRQGETLTAALAPFLPELAVGLLSCAERAGRLEEGLKRLAGHYEREAALADRLKTALVYPAFILIMSILTLAGFIIFILPSFAEIIGESGGELPWLTRTIFFLTALAVDPKFLLGVLSVLGSMVWFWRRRFSAEQRERLILALPFAGQLYRQSVAGRGLASLSLLLASGGDLLFSLERVAADEKSPTCRRSFSLAVTGVARGESLSAALGNGFFSAETIALIRLGENTGRLGELLAAASEQQSQARERLLGRLLPLLEPLLTLGAGGVVAVLALALFLPLLNMLGVD